MKGMTVHHAQGKVLGDRKSLEWCTIPFAKDMRTFVQCLALKLTIYTIIEFKDKLRLFRLVHPIAAQLRMQCVMSLAQTNKVCEN